MRPPEEIEDIILRKVFLVKLVDSMEDDSRVVYLERTAAELLNEDKDFRLSRDLLERVLVDRLTGNFLNAEPPVRYLVNCYRRASEEGRKIASMKDKNVRSEMEFVLKQAKNFAASYCRIALGTPDMFPNSDAVAGTNSPLLPLILSAVDGFGNNGDAAPPGFLEELFREGDYDSVEPIMKQLYKDLSGSVLKVSALGNFQQPLRAVLMLINFPVGAKSLVSHPQWIPNPAYINGRLIEVASILGPFFHVSALPDHNTLYKSQPDVGQQCFSDSSQCRPGANVLSSSTTIRTVMNSLNDGLAEVMRSLLKNANTRENVLQFLAVVINKNTARAHMQVDPSSCASTGMFVNLSSVMLRLCEPFLDANLTKRDKIDPKYVFHGTRLELRGLTSLHASSEEVNEWLLRNNDCKENGKFHFISECFFMTARAVNLGLLKAFSEWNNLGRNIARCKEKLSALKKMQGQTPCEHLQQNIASLEKTIGLYSQEESCYEAQVLRDTGLVQRALSFYRLMLVWLVDLVGGFKMPLASTCPLHFAAMPEHFVDDAMELVIYASRIPKALDGVELDDFMNFIVMFMASPDFVRNPYLRAKMVEVLKMLMPRNKGSSAMATLFESHQLSLEYLVRNLLKLYVDIEFTGSHGQFYDKFNIRHDIAELLEYLWQVPRHRTAWRQIAKEEEKGFYLNFVNFLINDSIYLLDESLNKILEMKELEAEMANKVEWERRSGQEKQERTRRFQSLEKLIRVDMKMANEDVRMLGFTTQEITAPFLLPEMVERVASMLNYFLLQLVGPQRNSLSLKDPERYEFRPKILVKQIVDMYVNLSRGDTESVFTVAIAKDCRSYSEQIFSGAADVLGKIGEDAKIIQEFRNLGEKAKAAATEAMDAETALGEIPDEFLDPIQYTLMRDPVILPSSRITIDRLVIQRHLLSDSTDPFNRSRLTADMLIPNNELKAKIEEFVQSRESKLRGKDLS
ncbi:OLC1v1036520C1 [Oldenlandia corymbosa var. corymbosa]|uniref:RING-type E3 ubiquitin transferase n=1 Tax=Oldenlandia corymbosa var. corymbosa TaxID=529605 RepID=A0AAV1CVH9_OLDCO|nr:OLC1v1036520C1 [Oldenlandia corymbosa var. corymbosa]